MGKNFWAPFIKGITHASLLASYSYVAINMQINKSSKQYIANVIESKIYYNTYGSCGIMLPCEVHTSGTSHKVGSKFVGSWGKVCTKLARSSFVVEPKLARSSVKVGPNFVQSGPKLCTKWPQTWYPVKFTLKWKHIFRAYCIT